MGFQRDTRIAQLIELGEEQSYGHLTEDEAECLVDQKIQTSKRPSLYPSLPPADRRLVLASMIEHYKLVLRLHAGLPGKLFARDIAFEQRALAAHECELAELDQEVS